MCYDDFFSEKKKQKITKIMTVSKFDMYWFSHLTNWNLESFCDEWKMLVLKYTQTRDTFKINIHGNCS